MILEPWAVVLQYQTKFGTYIRSERNLERLWEVNTIHLLSNAMPQTYTMFFNFAYSYLPRRQG